jgi:hypothetical protein
MTSKDVVHKWTRYWAPEGTVIPTEWGSEPYLLDPEGEYNSQATRKLRSLQQIAAETFGCIILCGEPGMGKTRTVENWLASKDKQDVANRIVVNFRDVPDRSYFERLTVASNAWQEWRAGWHAGERRLTLVVDGVDEGIIKVPGFVEYLVGRLGEEPIERLQLVMVCRSLDWPVSEGERLQKLWPSDQKCGKFELCQLRRRDVSAAAADYRIDVGKFVIAVRREGLAELAMLPLTLGMLLLEHKQHRGFHGNRGELIRRYIRSLAGEVDLGRHTRLMKTHHVSEKYSDDDCYRCSTRIAAFMLLCGKSTLRLAGPIENLGNELSIGDVSRGWRGVDGLIPPPELVRLATRAPIFTARGAHCIRFYHQVLAEALAAEFLYGLPTTRQVELLSNRDHLGSYLEPPLAEIAAWLAIQSVEFRAYVMQHEPASLLRADISSFSAVEKRALVEQLLRAAGEERFFDAQNERRYFQGLAHPELAQQLRGYICDRSEKFLVRRLALTIAAACRSHQNLSDVISCLSDATDTKIHRVAASEIPDLFKPSNAALIAALMRNRIATIDRRTRFWCAIALLRGNSWSLRRILPHADLLLEPQSGESLLLAQYRKPADIPALLAFSLRRPGSHNIGSAFYGLFKAGFIDALPKWHTPVLRKLLARVWLSAARHGRGLQGELGSTLRQQCDTDVAGRRAFIEEIARASDLEPQVVSHLVTGIFHDSDLKWMFQRALLLKGRASRNFAEIAGHVYRPDRYSECFDDLLKARDAVPAIHQQFFWMRAWELTEDIALNAKRSHALILAGATDPAGPVRADAKEIWATDLRILESSPPQVWIRASYNLFYAGDPDAFHQLEADVSKAPGWKIHDAKARERLRSAARRFLLHYRGEPGFYNNNLDDWGIAAYQAIVLLEGDIARDASLRSAIKLHWLPTIINWFGSANSRDSRLVRCAFRLDPIRTGELLEYEMGRQAVSENALILCVRKYSVAWNGVLGAREINWVLRYPDLRPRALGSLTRELADVSSSTAWKLWTAVSRSSAFNTDRKAAVFGALLDKRLWILWPRIRGPLSDRVFARAAFLEAATYRDITSQKAIGKVANPKSIADVYLLLRELFPISEDEPLSTASSTTSLRTEVARWRNGLPQALAALATSAACKQLERIASETDGHERIWIRGRLQEALDGKRRKDWNPVEPSALSRSTSN